MDQVVEFGKKYGGWIAGAVGAVVVAVVATKVITAGDDEFVTMRMKFVSSDEEIETED